MAQTGVVRRVGWRSWPQILDAAGPVFRFRLGNRGVRFGHFGMPKAARPTSSSHALPQVGQAFAQELPGEAGQVEFDITWAPLPQLPDDSTYFFARWRHEPDSQTFDYPFLETAGHGHFVGVSMPIDHPLAGWWGEGDDKVWVDDDDFPP